MKRYRLHIPLIVLILSMCLLSACGSSDCCHKMSVKNKLKDNRKLEMAFKITFASKKGVQDLRMKESQFKFAITMVVSRQNSSVFEIKTGGKTRAVNMLKSISRQLLEEEVKKITLTKYVLK